MFLIIYIFIFFGFSPTVLENDFTIYQQALTHIKKTSEYETISKGKNKYYVSNELPSFYLMGWFYKKELQPYVNVREEDFTSESNKSILSNNDLVKLSTKKCAKIKVFFSEIKENIFFSEVIESSKKSKKYADRPHFGRSYVYMFQIKGGDVYLLGVKEIAYN